MTSSCKSTVLVIGALHVSVLLAVRRTVLRVATWLRVELLALWVALRVALWVALWVAVLRVALLITCLVVASLAVALHPADHARADHAKQASMGGVKQRTGSR